MAQGGSSAGGGKWSDSRRIGQGELTEVADGRNVEDEGKGESKMTATNSDEKRTVKALSFGYMK